MSLQRGLREMTSMALIPFVRGREITTSCGTLASHTARVSLGKVAQYQLVSPCLKVIKRTGLIPNQCVHGRLRPIFNVKFLTSDKFPNSIESICLNSKGSKIIVFPTRTPLKHISYNSAQLLSILAYKRISWVSRLWSVTCYCFHLPFQKVKHIINDKNLLIY